MAESLAKFCPVDSAESRTFWILLSKGICKQGDKGAAGFVFFLLPVIYEGKEVNRGKNH